MLKTFEAKVYVRNGNSRIMHTVRVQADSSFAAQQLLSAQYGQNNVVGVPTEVRNSNSTFVAAPWMRRNQ
jgi:hypothetical protein